MTVISFSRRALLALAAAVLMIPWSPAFSVEDMAALPPDQLMSKVASDMLNALDQKRADVRRDPKLAYPLVDQILLPHFDTQYAAQLILAQNWRTASEDQRKRFVAALYDALLKTYAGAIADFTADRLKILPLKLDPGATQTIVRSEVRRDNGTIVPVDYRMHKTDSGWKAYDVIIEGISYVRNYREDFGAEVAKKGLDEVIARLEREGLHVDRAGKSSGG
jgi:phospholipid transport system substrate-binding protein